MMKKTSFKVDEKVYTELKIISIRQGRQIQDILNDIITEYVEKHKEE